MRRAAKKDSNHNEITDGFKRLGWIVLDLHQLKNACDCAVAKDGMTLMVEIKDGAKPPSQRKLTKGESDFREYWSQEGRWVLVESVEDVQQLDETLGIMRFNETDGQEDERPNI